MTSCLILSAAESYTCRDRWGNERSTVVTQEDLNRIAQNMDSDRAAALAKHRKSNSSRRCSNGTVTSEDQLVKNPEFLPKEEGEVRRREQVRNWSCIFKYVTGCKHNSVQAIPGLPCTKCAFNHSNIVSRSVDEESEDLILRLKIEKEWMHDEQ